MQYKLDKASYKRFEEFFNAPDDMQLTDRKLPGTPIRDISFGNLKLKDICLSELYEKVSYLSQNAPALTEQ